MVSIVTNDAPKNKLDWSKLDTSETASTATASWWIQAEGKNYGPYNKEDIIQFAKQGRIVPKTLLSHMTSTKNAWVPANRLRFLVSVFSSSLEPPISSRSSQETWSIRSQDGLVFGPYSLNDVLNFVAFGKLKSDALIMSSQRFNGEWVAAFRIPEIASTLRQSMEFMPSRKERTESSKFSTNRTLAFVSGGSFVLAGLIWLSTIIGFPIAMIAFFMAAFNIVSAAIASDKSSQWCHTRFQLIGILDIVMGFVTLGNIISIICGIVNLSVLPPASGNRSNA